MEETARRRMRSKAERRQIVEETLQPGASVAQIAQAHGVNANLVFNWRRLYREGRLEAEPETKLLPVRISDSIQKVEPRGRDPRPTRSGIIDIDLGHARVRIEGAADPECVRAAVEGLRR
jgi:transposase